MEQFLSNIITTEIPYLPDYVDRNRFYTHMIGRMKMEVAKGNCIIDFGPALGTTKTCLHVIPANLRVYTFEVFEIPAFPQLKWPRDVRYRNLALIPKNNHWFCLGRMKLYLREYQEDGPSDYLSFIGPLTIDDRIYLEENKIKY